MPLTSAAVEFLFRFEAVVLAPISVSPGPAADRLIVGVSGGSFAGPRLRGKLLPGQGSEWATARRNGSLRADVRLVLETDDGAHILMTYNGIAKPRDGRLGVIAAPQFETSDERYSWLNDVQAVSYGSPVENGIGYDVYDLSWPESPE